MSELPKYLTQPQILKRGWTESAIAKFLGEPLGLRTSPTTGQEHPYWESKQVVKIEASSGFSKWKQKKQLMDIIENSRVSINKMELDAVKFAAVNSYNHLHVGEQGFRFATVNSEKSFLDRILVNYLRHDQTNYDSSLKLLSNKVGKEQAYALLKNKVLMAIAQAYPSLADECIRQRVSLKDVLGKLR